MENKVLIINRCEYTIKEFIDKFFKEYGLDDGYILYNVINGKDEYYLEKSDVVGVELQRDIEVYTLKKC